MYIYCTLGSDCKFRHNYDTTKVTSGQNDEKIMEENSRLKQNIEDLKQKYEKS
jgi:hypothetical protein